MMGNYHVRFGGGLLEKYRRWNVARQLASFLPYMYLGSPIPIIGEWKTNNPKAFNQVAIGLALAAFAGGGGVATLLAF